MDIFNSPEDANAAAVMDSVAAAFNAGLTNKVTDEGHVLCARPDSMELVDIFPDGSWEYQNVSEEGKTESMSGTTAALLSLYLNGNKELFEKSQDE